MTEQPSEQPIDYAADAPAPEPSINTAPDEIIAMPDIRYRGKHMIFALVMIVVGFWFAYDGWIGWPKHNQEVRAVEQGIVKATDEGDVKQADDLKAKLSKMHKPYTPADILIQKLLAGALPLLGLAYGYWTWHATRGRLRLSGNTLEIPGHGEIPLTEIRSIDKTRWERKGIAIVRYQAHHPQRERSFNLDDFAYQRKPTDDILDQLEAYMAPPPEMGVQGEEVTSETNGDELPDRAEEGPAV